MRRKIPGLVFNDTATTEIYTLSLHDALPICRSRNNSTFSLFELPALRLHPFTPKMTETLLSCPAAPRAILHKIGRAHGLNSSHANISYAVFCLKKKYIYLVF